MSSLNAICLLTTVMIIGCAGSDGLERVVVSGTVMYNGKMIPNGQIRFVPIKGTQGPVSGGSIAEGKYTADGLGGVPVGTHRVEIRAFRDDEDAEPDPIEGDLPREQYLPEKYNVKSELEITVPPDSGAITQDYDLVD